MLMKEKRLWCYEMFWQSKYLKFEAGNYYEIRGMLIKDEYKWESVFNGSGKILF